MAELAASTADHTTGDREILEGDDEVVEADELVEAELLIEDVSIDGMCGVY